MEYCSNNFFTLCVEAKSLAFSIVLVGCGGGGNGGGVAVAVPPPPLDVSSLILAQLNDLTKNVLTFHRSSSTVRGLVRGCEFFISSWILDKLRCCLCVSSHLFSFIRVLCIIPLIFKTSLLSSAYPIILD